MADEPEDLPVATALPKKAEPVHRGIVIDPAVIGVGGGVAVLGVLTLIFFLWMVPGAATREGIAACRGLHGYDTMDRRIVDGRPTPPEHGPMALCPEGKPCQPPVPAPDFTAIDNNGKHVKLSDYRGKVVLLNFWASWCGVCKQEKPSLAGMASELSSGDFVVLTLSSDRSWGDALIGLLHSLAAGAPTPRADASGNISMQSVLDVYGKALPHGVPFQVLLDPPDDDGTIGAIAKSWGVTAFPESALIDRKGVIRAYFVNKRDWSSPVAQTCLRSVIDE
jgi:thiol-disulfide isomerase/thioredoxin